MTRTEWGRQFPTCWLCDGAYPLGWANPLTTHEIARGVHRSKAVLEPAAWIRCCLMCHDTLAGMTIAQQLALKKLHDPEHYDRSKVCSLRGRADTSVTDEEVAAAVKLWQ